MGYPLIGGRLDHAGKRSVAAVVYQHRRHLINLFIWPSTGSGSTTGKALTQNGYNMIMWDQSGMTFWAVSDVKASDLREFVRLVR